MQNKSNEGNDIGSKLVSFVRLLRPNQWLKNTFIFLPLFFSRHLFDWNYMSVAFLSFFSFCWMASAVYCFNDIWDVNADCQHPTKRKRPIASGVVRKSEGYCLMVFCIFLSLGLLMLLPKTRRDIAMGILFLYLLMNIAYCVRLKHFAIIDVFVISFGFVLRVLVGGYTTGIPLSHWIVLMTFLLALLLALAKRRDDILMYESVGVLVRKNINSYNMIFIDQTITIVSTLTVVCYIMYSVDSNVMSLFHSRHVFITSLFVLAGIVKYLQITVVFAKSGSPTKVLMRNHFIHLCILGWMLSFLVIIYL